MMQLALNNPQKWCARDRHLGFDWSLWAKRWRLDVKYWDL